MKTDAFTSSRPYRLHLKGWENGLAVEKDTIEFAYTAADAITQFRVQYPSGMALVRIGPAPELIFEDG